MTTIGAQGDDTYRDYVVTGLPSSGENEPDKANIRLLNRMVEAAIQAVGLANSAGTAYTTVALLNADLAHAAGSLGYVYNDPTPANIGIYAKSGASGSGSWAITNIALPGSTAADLADARNRITELETPLSILTLTATPAVAEVGATVTVTLDWTLSKDGTSQTIDQGVGAIAPVSTRTKAVTGQTANKTWTLTLVNSYKTVTKSASVSFLAKLYYGTSTLTSLTSAQIIALTGVFDGDYHQSGLTFDCTGGKYPYIAWPTTYGAPSQITVGGLAFTDFTISVVSVTNASGFTQNYNVLRFNGLQTGSNIQVTT